jgi:hypothetical protein
MGLFDWLKGAGGAAGETIKGTLEGAGSFARDIRSAITGDIDPEKRAELIARAEELEHEARNAQVEVNLQEAKHASIFVAGARPAVLWVCVLALFYNFVFRPLAVGFGLTDMPVIDAASLWPIMGGVLGLGGMRSWEKSQGVNDRHG